MSLLAIDGLTIRYGDTAVVDGLSFTVEKGESVGLVGESGSGKTQTALAVLGLLPASASTDGSIEVAGEQVIGRASRALDQLRARRVAMVFQDPADALNPYVSVGEQVARVLLAHRLATAAEAKRRVIDMLGAVGLPDPERQAKAWPHQLSGGMRQRVMIASALITKPDLLIADEPTTALDVTVQAQILDLLDAIRQDTALLLITHDLGVVAGHCHRVLVLRGGRLVEEGGTAAIFQSPQQAHTRALIDAAPKLAADAAPADCDGEPLLTVEHVSVSYPARGRRRLDAVKNIDLTLKSNETLAIVGESGSGKSSLARAIVGLATARGGTVRFLGQPLPGDARDRDNRVRRDLQMVFQDPQGSLNPQMRVADIVREPLLVHAPADRAGHAERVADMLQQVGLGDEFLERYPHELSGGQSQRVAIARALIVKPQVLVCDEAVAALDGTVRRQILDLLESLQKEYGLSILFISHDLGVVCSISHRVFVMYLGEVVEIADGRTLFSSPRHPYTRALIDAVPVPDPEGRGHRASLAGEVPSPLTPPSGCVFHTRCPFVEQQCIDRVPDAQKIGDSTVRCHRAQTLDLKGPQEN